MTTLNEQAHALADVLDRRRMMLLCQAVMAILAAGVNTDGSGKLVQRADGTRAEAEGLAARLGERLLAEVALR